jgi:SOS-response transcriptional repressor LexA
MFKQDGFGVRAFLAAKGLEKGFVLEIFLIGKKDLYLMPSGLNYICILCSHIRYSNRIFDFVKFLFSLIFTIFSDNRYMGRKRKDFESAEVFWENYRRLLSLKREKEYLLLEKAHIPQSTIISARTRNAFPNIIHIRALAKALNVQIEDFFKTPETFSIEIHNHKGEKEPIDVFDIVLVPVYAQTAAAGSGQESLDDVSIIGKLPFLKRMLRGIAPTKARALEVRGDSMTGIQLFDGDIVVFIPGEIHGDGIYVIRVMNDIFVKRIEFDPVNRKIRIMSENRDTRIAPNRLMGRRLRLSGKSMGGCTRIRIDFYLYNFKISVL